ncbi:MAG TPA: hypothetical protein VFS43_04115 [Polyangiaceae bacterium]|nr:hypothetical protein [Polyangiaceae bacterium]
MAIPKTRRKKRRWHLTVTGLDPLPIVLPTWERERLLPALERLASGEPPAPTSPEVGEADHASPEARDADPA